MTDTILIVDFGSQSIQLIARRVREACVFCEIVPPHQAESALLRLSPKAIILSGSPLCASDESAQTIPPAILNSQLPILGICYGQQILVHLLGGKIGSKGAREFGRARLQVKQAHPLFDKIVNVGETIEVWMSHGDFVETLPKGFVSLGATAHAPFAVIGDDERRFYGVQFHPEMVHTQKGKEFLQNFIYKIAQCKGGWSMESYKDFAIEKIRQQVQGKRVICALSGGVDSSVVAILLHQAIGDQLDCVYVDTGLMREGESNEVIELFRKHYKIRLKHIDAGDRFFAALKHITDPEQKRKIIGKVFIDVFEEEAKQLGEVDFLAQGTLYPDVVESVSFQGGVSQTIKSHHNVGGLPERMNLKLVEPLRALFKDEVRALGHKLGLADSFIKRHPFPGPALAIRALGEVTREKIEIVRQADFIYLEEIEKAGLYDEIWQAFCVLLPVRTVGVMGDARSYEFVCALRAVKASDGMTAEHYPFSHSFLSKVATRIINEVKGINRVVYDITSKPPATIEWE